ncbi:hypothetical protein D3C87_2117790 [compost metagenome]
MPMLIAGRENRLRSSMGEAARICWRTNQVRRPIPATSVMPVTTGELPALKPDFIA